MEPQPPAPKARWIAAGSSYQAASGPVRRVKRTSGGSAGSAASTSSSPQVRRGGSDRRALLGSSRGRLSSRSERNIKTTAVTSGGGRRRPRVMRSNTSRTLAINSTRGSPARTRGDGVRSSSSRAPAGGSMSSRRVSASSVPSDFQLLSLLGRGTIGRVYLARHKASGLYYAIKRISRTEVCRRKNMRGVLAEVDTLRDASNPFIIDMFCAIQDKKFTYIVLEYAVGGELYTRMGLRFGEDSARFYMAEIFWALQYLHSSLTTAYRDLKPENILIDQTGHIRLVDFGFAIRLDGEHHEVPKSCGTTQYMAPELVQRKGRHGLAVDWWAAGCIMYEMLTGHTPFGDIGDKSKWEIYANVAKGKKIKFPSHVSKDAQDLIRRLLHVNASKRAKWNDVSRSAWLQDISWEAVAGRKLVPPFVPDCKVPGSRENFPARSAKVDNPDIDLSAEQLAYTDINKPRNIEGSA